MNGDCQWITTLHYAFQDENYLVCLIHQQIKALCYERTLFFCILKCIGAINQSTHALQLCFGILVFSLKKNIKGLTVNVRE